MANVQVKGLHILIIDDHPASRKWVIYFLNNSPSITKFNEAIDGFEAIAALEKSAYDIVYLDVQMPKMNGIETARIIKQRFPNTKIIVFTMVDCKKSIVQMLELGVEGYISKEEDEIIKAFDEVSEGRPYLSPPIAKIWCEYLADKTIHPYTHIAKENTLEKPNFKSRFNLFFTALKSRIF